MSRLTFIVVPDETTDRVRRFRVSRRWLGRGLAGAVVVAVVGAVVLVDYVRLRRDAVDVEALRAQSRVHEAELDSLGAQVSGLEEEFGRLREFERKVRVIADLPGALPEAGSLARRDGQGGGEEEAGADEPGPGAAPASAGGPAKEASSADRGPLALDAASLARVRSKAQHIDGALALRTESFEALLRDLEGKRERLASTPSIWPAEGWVTSRYGYRTSPFTGQRQFHGGIDIAADFGTPILAPARGRVVFSGRKGALGYTVVLDHGHGLRTLFGHAAEVLVKRGARVERGARIATVGSSGRSTGPHLHYAVSVEGKNVDPSDYILE